MKMRYTHIYPSAYDVLVQILLPNHALVQKWGGNVELVCLQSVSHFLRHITHMSNYNISGCD